MKYCFSTTKGTFSGESMYAKDLGLYVFYDEKNDVFLNENDEVIDVCGMELFPRTGGLQAADLIDAIYRHGANSLVKVGDYEKSLDWPKYIHTSRNNVVMSGREILDNPQSIVDIFGIDRVFFKTKNKNYSQIIDVSKLLDKDGSFCKVIEAHQDDDFIISDVVEIMSDDFGPLEYRGFVIDGELFNVSRVHDYLMERVPEEYINKMKNVIESVKDSEFPKTFVVDVFSYVDDKGNSCVDVLECNPLVASGTYLYNSVFSKTSTLEHGDIVLDIPAEKMKYGPKDEYGVDVVSRGRASICYELPGGFAADVISFSMFGELSEGSYIHLETSHNVNPLNIGSYFTSLNLIDFEDELGSDEDFIDSDLDDDALVLSLKKLLLDDDSE